MDLVDILELMVHQALVDILAILVQEFLVILVLVLVVFLDIQEQ